MRQKRLTKFKKKARLKVENVNNDKKVGNNKIANPLFSAIAAYPDLFTLVTAFLSLFIPVTASFGSSVLIAIFLGFFFPLLFSSIFQPLALSLSAIPALLALLSLFVLVFLSLFVFFHFFSWPTTLLLPLSLQCKFLDQLCYH